MQDQASAPAGGRRGDEAQFVVLSSLLDAAGPALWSAGELARAVGCELAAAEALVVLHADGLVHLSGGLACATRPACRFAQLLRE